MIIKEGFDSKATHLKFYPRQGERIAELYLSQEGLEDVKETLSYVTLDELLDLQKEIKDVIAEIVK